MGPAAPGDERLPRRSTLRRPAEFRLAYRHGVRRHDSLMTLHVRPSGDEPARLGITVSRKVGGAVVRNRLKRWTRETFRRSPRRTALAGHDLVVHYKPAAARASHAEVSARLERLLGSALAGARR